MGENTAIEWADHTFNPWIGCTAVSLACDYCYAEQLATTRLGVAWGPKAERRVTAESTWRLPVRWNRKAEASGRPCRVFSGSLCDIFDNQVPEAWRTDLWRLIDQTPALTWLLLTKRPQNIAKMMPASWVWPAPAMPRNIWLGTTVENQDEADRRIPHLLAVPAARHFLSCEPLLGPVRLKSHWIRYAHPMAKSHPDAYPDRRIDWVICGGESGAKARPMHPDWARGLRDQCAAAGVPFFFKQWGEYHAARPVYPHEDRTWSKIAAERAFGPGTSPDEVDLDCTDGIEDFMREFPSLGVLYRSGYFYDGTEYQPHVGSGCWWMERVGKKAAGALLDGREHREAPHG